MNEKFEGKFERLNDFIIFLNIDQLKNGQYKLKLLQENKIIKEFKFEKKKLQKK